MANMDILKKSLGSLLTGMFFFRILKGVGFAAQLMVVMDAMKTSDLCIYSILSENKGEQLINTFLILIADLNYLFFQKD